MSETAITYRKVPEAVLPVKATPGSVAYDIYSIEEGTLYPGDTKSFSTGLVIKPPPGHYIKVWARSGWGKKFGVGIPHGAGIIDEDYCGPDDVISVILHRACSSGYTNKEYTYPLKISKGDRIAQITFEKKIDVDFIESITPPEEKSRGGFGSTGVK